MKFLLDSTEACLKSAAEIGSKAFRLGQLNRIDMPVPRWCVLPAEALSSRLKSNRDSHGLHLSGDDTAELKFWLERRQREGHHRFIVRASVQVLDSKAKALSDADASAALGNLEAYPNLKSFDSIKNAVIECVKSVKTLHFFVESGDEKFRHPSELQVSVIVQVMIDAERSGILYTANPKDGNRRHFLISSNFGACESVVSGDFECDEYEIHLSNETVERRIGKKTRALKFANLGAEGLVAYDLPPFMQSKPSLDDDELVRLISTGKQLTLWAKMPLDIEWVMHGKDPWIVQMRPLPNISLDRSTDNKLVFDKSRLQICLAGPVLPLTISFINEVAQLMARELARWSALGANSSNLTIARSPLLGFVKGQVFLNLNSWAKLLPLSFKRDPRRKSLTTWLGISDNALPLMPGARPKASTLSIVKALPRMALATARQIVPGFVLDWKITEFRARFQTAFQGFPRRELPWMSVQDIFIQKEQFENKVAADLFAPTASRVRAARNWAALRQLVAKIQTIPDGSLQLNRLCEDLIIGVETDTTTRSLVEIVEKIRKTPMLMGSLHDLSDDEFSRLLHGSPALNRMIEDHVESHTDGVDSALKLESVTVRENRSQLYDKLRSLIKKEPITVAQLNGEALKTRREAELRLDGQITKKYGAANGFYMRLRLKRLAKTVRQSFAQQARLRTDLAKTFGLMRSIYLALAERLIERGLLSEASDIFYMTTDEVTDLFKGRALFDRPESLIQMRKSQYAEWGSPVLADNLSASLPFLGALSQMDRDRAFDLLAAVEAPLRAAANMKTDDADSAYTDDPLNEPISDPLNEPMSDPLNELMSDPLNEQL